MTDETEEETMESIMNPAEDPVKEEVKPEPEAEPSPAVEEKKDDGVQKRINKLTAEKYEFKRKLDELQAKMDETEAEKPEVKPPELEDFDYDEDEYRKALVKDQVARELEIQRAQQVESEQRASVNLKQKEAEQSFAEKEAKFATETADYAESVQKLPSFHQDILETIYSLDDGPKMAYYLANHLDTADEIATSTPLQAAVRLGQIANGFTNPKGSVGTTKAPEPVETISGAGSVAKDTEEMSMDEIYNMP